MICYFRPRYSITAYLLPRPSRQVGLGALHVDLGREEELHIVARLAELVVVGGQTRGHVGPVWEAHGACSAPDWSDGPIPVSRVRRT